MPKKPKDPKPKRYIGPKRGHVIEHPSGAVLVVSIVCGLRYFDCPRFPEIAQRYDGANDDTVNDAIDLFERLAGGGPP